jgi:hypothetical protein
MKNDGIWPREKYPRIGVYSTRSFNPSTQLICLPPPLPIPPISISLQSLYVHIGGSVTSGRLVIDRSSLRENAAATYGGGLAALDFADVALSACNVSGNSAAAGGGGVALFAVRWPCPGGSSEASAFFFRVKYFRVTSAHVIPGFAFIRVGPLPSFQAILSAQDTPIPPLVPSQTHLAEQARAVRAAALQSAIRVAAIANPPRRKSPCH